MPLWKSRRATLVGIITIHWYRLCYYDTRYHCVFYILSFTMSPMRMPIIFTFSAHNPYLCICRASGGL